MAFYIFQIFYNEHALFLKSEEVSLKVTEIGIISLNQKTMKLLHFKPD